MEEEIIKKKCTKCGSKKLPEEFEKGSMGKRTSRCKTCANKYSSNRTKKLRKGNNLVKGEAMKETPLFEKGLTGEHVKNIKVQRTQMVMLSGDVDKIIKTDCPCGLGVDLEYQHSYDQKNDYYEASCPVCGKTFKLNVVSK
jgi:hypothetical protein